MTALEAATKVTAQVVGKPTAEFYGQALEELEVQPEDTVMIGDVSTISRVNLFNFKI